MRLLLVANFLILTVGISYTFRITEFLDPFFRARTNNHNQIERQDSDITDQILPLFLVTFAASTVWNLLTMNLIAGGAQSPTVTITDCDNYHWCYEGDCAASTWGQCFDACNGMKQSPIDIPKFMLSSGSKPLTFSKYDEVKVDVLKNTNEHYNFGGVEVGGDGERITDGTLKNNGHTAQLDVTVSGDDIGRLSGGPLQSGSTYKILQLHFHWGSNDARGSEHTVGGREYPIEMHIVHTRNGFSDPLNTPTGLAVTGFFFEISPIDNVALFPLTSALSSIVNSKDSIPFSGSSFNIKDLISPVATTSAYTYYSGSLTTPTCNEVVEWINILTPLKISSRQLALFRELMDGKNKKIVDNYRPPQPLNGRTVTLYGQ